MAGRPKGSSFDPQEQFRLATFVVGDDLFAIDIMRIREILRPLPVTPVPRAPSGMVGVIDLRGQVFPLFDLRQRFGLPARVADDDPLVRQLIVTLDGRTVGLVVDAVQDVVNVTRGDLRLGDGVLTGESAEVCLGVCPIRQEGGERLALLLNLRRVLMGDADVKVAELLGRAALSDSRTGAHAAAAKRGAP